MAICGGSTVRSRSRSAQATSDTQAFSSGPVITTQALTVAGSANVDTGFLAPGGSMLTVSGLLTDTKPAPQHREFVQAAGVGDLPGELMSALSQGLSQFGVNLPPVPSLTGATSPGLASPGLTSPGLTDPSLASPGLTSPGLTSPGLTSPGLTSPGLTSPGLTSPGLTSPGLTSPGLTPGTTPGLTPGATPGLTSPGLTPGTTPGLTPGATPGLTSPTAFGPSSATPGALPNPSEFPISDPVGLDPGAGGTYPILGDPSLGAAPSGGAGVAAALAALSIPGTADARVARGGAYDGTWNVVFATTRGTCSSGYSVPFTVVGARVTSAGGGRVSGSVSRGGGASTSK